MRNIRWKTLLRESTLPRHLIYAFKESTVKHLSIDDDKSLIQINLLINPIYRHYLPGVDQYEAKSHDWTLKFTLL